MSTLQGKMVLPTEVTSTQMLGSIGLIIFSIVMGLVFGGILFASSLLIYLICFSPIIAGLVAGFAMQKAVEFTKVHSFRLASIASVLMVVALYGAYRYGEYLDFKRVSRADIEESFPAADPALFNELIDAYLKDEVGSTGFIGFIKLQAEEGLTIRSTRYSTSTSSGSNIGTTPTMIYWLFELLIIFVCIVGFSGIAATQPFCTDTNQWLAFEYAGTVPPQNLEAFVQALQREEWQQAKGLLVSDKSSVPRLEIQIGRCHAGAGEALIHMVTVKRDNRNNISREVAKKTRVAPQAYDAFVT